MVPFKLRRLGVAELVFPTGVDRRSDLGDTNRIDVYYGMADSRIGAARLDVPTRGSDHGGIHDAGTQLRVRLRRSVLTHIGAPRALRD